MELILADREAQPPYTAALTLRDLRAMYVAVTAAGITPHRCPDFDKIAADCNGDGIALAGHCCFIESNNTGYDGWLDRWIMHPVGNPNIEFMIDLPTGAIHSVAVEAEAA